MNALDRLVDDLDRYGCNPHNGSASCPADGHFPDKSPSLSYGAGNACAIVNCQRGCLIEDVLRPLGRTTADLFDTEKATNGTRPTILATYDYTDENGVVVLQQVRLSPKGFYQRRPDGKGGWINGLTGVRQRPLYRLPAIIEAVGNGATVYICEGEKDVHALERFGLVATTKLSGAGGVKWQQEHFRPLRGGANPIVALPDNDISGEDYIHDFTTGIGSAADVRVLRLPGLPEKGDVSDWIAAGGTAEQLQTMVDELFASAPAADRADPRVPDHDDDEKRVLELIPASRIRLERTTWLSAGRIPLGGVTLLVGQEGCGKTNIAGDTAARATRGNLPGDLHGEPISVVYATAEDSWNRTLAPRLIAAGADMDRVFAVHINGLSGGLAVPSDLTMLSKQMKAHEARLLILDPLGAHLDSGLDTHKDAAVRQALAPLAATMDNLNAACIGIMHWSKAPSMVALDRVNGSRGFTAAARSMLGVGEDPQDPTVRLFLLAKSNLGRLDVPALRYRIETRFVESSDGPIETSGVVWLGEAPGMTARDLFSQAQSDDDRSDVDEMADLLRELLTDGPMAVDEVKRLLRQSGHSVNDRQLRRARAKAGVEYGKPQTFGGKRTYRIADNSVDTGETQNAVRTTKTDPTRDFVDESDQSRQCGQLALCPSRTDEPAPSDEDFDRWSSQDDES